MMKHVIETNPMMIVTRHREFEALVAEDPVAGSRPNADQALFDKQADWRALLDFEAIGVRRLRSVVEVRAKLPDYPAPRRRRQRSPPIHEKYY